MKKKPLLQIGLPCAEKIAEDPFFKNFQNEKRAPYRSIGTLQSANDFRDSSTTVEIFVLEKMKY